MHLSWLGNTTKQDEKNKKFDCSLTKSLKSLEAANLIRL